MAWLSAFLAQPIDVMLYQLTVIFGWIGTTAVLAWGFIQMWKNQRQGDYMQTLQHVLLAINVPAMTEQTPKAVEVMFSNLIGTFGNLNFKEQWLIGKVQPTFSFEIVSNEGYIQFYVWAQTKFRDLLEANIYAHYPEAEISEVGDYVSFLPSNFPDEHYDAWGAEVTLKKDEYFPIRTYADFEDKIAGELRDPLAQILEQLGKMRPGEHFWMQVVVQPGSNDWKEKGSKFINKTYGVEEKHKPGMIESGMSAALAIPSALLQEAVGIGFGGGHEEKEVDQWKAFKISPTQKEQVEGVLEKTGKIGLPTKIRLIYAARKEAFNKGARASMLKGLLQPYGHLNLNSFAFYPPSIPKDDYFWQRWSYPKKQGRLVRAYKKRSWGIGATPRVLNAEELATLWHFPAITVKAPLVHKAEARRGEPPVGLPIDFEGTQMPPLPARAAHDDHGGHAEPTHEPEAAPVPTPELPGLETMEAPQVAVSSDAPRQSGIPLSPRGVSDRSAPQEHPPVEERETGLDATDMGPPADVKLPGPPPGWKEKEARGEAADDEAPPNLPV
ncbi:hypothetical protein A2856_01805 [Candidatus Uhrbacteria bacterium RIFCSPHIGHO2_01_FULL_63_20]|uniref:DUF8128 domain-containing protein n=1 Tax=Candidatus Uhrbacteria bacterium RIFCSPHIGHO2_01_FULL_63_20 TaxID=1802385 RepID=A0A1F7TKB8_9BACT|nr:MAG: hypothetical protein A2856_01805 [Candidatus Uhrbacteria bacterium RIFCSPHIGHO2_01_FULL_63_20]